MPNSTPEYRAYKLLQQIIMGCTGLVVLFVFGMFVFGASKSQARCEDLQSFRSYVLSSTNRAIDSLPTIDYYKNHPQELDRAVLSLQQQRDEFANPLDCSLF